MVNIVLVDLVDQDYDVAFLSCEGRVALVAAADAQVVNVDFDVRERS